MVDAIRMWAETNGYMEDYDPAGSDTTFSSSQSTEISTLPETPIRHDGLLKLFYDDPVPDMGNSSQYGPHCIA